MRTTGVARSALIAALLAGVLSILAIGAPVALAADDLAVTTKARYVVAPANGLIKVAVDVAVVNQKPNGVSGGVVTRYFYDSVNLGVQLEATHLKATQDGTPVRVTSSTRKNFRLVTIAFRDDIYLGETAHVRLQFDLPAGEPRSESDVRVGPAFATFLAWAFGDRGSVRIDIPKAFDVDVSGEDMKSQTTANLQVLTATTDDALGWYAWINARNDDGLTRERLELADGEEVVVRGWPEDARWRRRVSTILSESVPDLAGRIGLPWPVDGPLNVLEVHTPLLEGYAGFYDPKSDEITISENLDDLTIVHEASHAWFNSGLFDERWINEGLAEEYASRVLAAETRGQVDPARVSPSAKAAFPLANWSPPAPIRDPQSDAREQFGYDASWTVIRAILEEAGEDGMQRVFRAAEAGTTAYPGEGTPERAALPNDWRRFLDLTEELGGVGVAASLFETWVLPKDEQGQLADRAAARAAYRELAATDGDWASPRAVRLALDSWSFDQADARIDEASEIVRQWDETEALASANGLNPPDELESAYEGATSGSDLAAASTLAANMQASLATVVAADEAADAPRDWLTTLGLSGKDPDADVAAARSAWQTGDLAEASERATLAAGTIGVAPEAGRGRAIVIGGAVALVGIVLLLLVIVVVVRWRGRSTPMTAVVPTTGIGFPSMPPEESPLAMSDVNAGEASIRGSSPPEAPQPPPPPFDSDDRPA